MAVADHIRAGREVADPLIAEVMKMTVIPTA